MNTNLFQAWQKYIPNLGPVLRQMQEKTLIAVGVETYSRIIPSIFLDNYIIYSVKGSADLDMLRNYVKVFCMEEKHPQVAAKTQATSYLLKNYIFQGFLKSWRKPLRLMLYQATERTVGILKELGIDWIGNPPHTYKGTVLKGEFRDLVKTLKLPSIPDWRLSREEFLNLTFQQVWDHWGRTAVIQRADFEVGGKLGTFFIHAEADWKRCYDVLSQDERYHLVTISPFIEGHSLSMLGCITPKGVLTSPLQLQLIDVPEALHGALPTGIFLGHDWAFHPWPQETEQAAMRIVEAIGEHLASKGYKGIFGIDLVYDAKTHDIFPIECNPRFTGALPVYSLMVAAHGVPTMEFFHIANHLGVDVDFDFEKVNAGLKQRSPVSHISLVPQGIHEMKLSLAAGVYSYDTATRNLHYERPGAFLWDIQKENEFLMLDSIPRAGSAIPQGVPGLFKLVIPKAIATSSSTIDASIGELITALSTALRKNQIEVAGARLASIDLEGLNT